MTRFMNLAFTLLLLNFPNYLAEESDSKELPCTIMEHDMKDEPKRWPGGIVPYVIISSQTYTGYSDAQLNKIKEAIAEWNLQIPEVQFVPLNKSHKDYVRIENFEGCFSDIGRVGDGAQELSLQKDGCLTTNIIHHEMMHTVGFFHEHNRHNRDEFVNVLWDNIPKSWKSEFKKFDPDEIIPNDLGPYDYYSIMHYETTLQGKTIMDILKEDVDISRINDKSKKISSIDKMKVRKFYLGE